MIPLAEESAQRKDFVFAPLILPDEHFRCFGLSDYQTKHFDSPDRVRGEKVSILLQYTGRSSDEPNGEGKCQ